MTKSSALQDRWKALAPREQNLVLAAGTVVALALLWWVAMAPALGTLRTAPARHAALAHYVCSSDSLRMVPGAGIEPATRGFSIRCSTN